MEATEESVGRKEVNTSKVWGSSLADWEKVSNSEERESKEDVVEKMYVEVNVENSNLLESNPQVGLEDWFDFRTVRVGERLGFGGSIHLESTNKLPKKINEDLKLEGRSERCNKCKSGSRFEGNSSASDEF